MTSTLTPIIETYILHRVRSGELTVDTARGVHQSLGKLAAVHGNRPIERLGPSVIDKWRESIGGMRATTRALHTAHVKTFCRYLAAHDYIRRDPTTHLRPIPKPRREPVTLTKAEVATLRDHVASDPKAAMIIALLHGLGARCIEVARLAVEDYDPVAKLITLTGKGGNQRTIPVTRSVAAALKRGIGRRRSGPMVPSEFGGYLRSKTLTELVAQWMYECGVKREAWDGRGAHSLRRTAATELLDEGADIRDAQELLGHADAATTLRHYQRRSGVERLRTAMERRDEAA